MGRKRCTLKTIKWKKVCLFFLCLSWTSVTTGVDNYPYFDPRVVGGDGYNLKKDGKPWFDGIPYPYFQDMYDGEGIKPQEEGTYQKFPNDSVPVVFKLGKVEKIYDPFVPLAQRRVLPEKPEFASATEESIVRGKTLYNAYCAACHGADGKAQTVVVEKGVPAPPITVLIQVHTESYLYNKIRYGSWYNSGKKIKIIPMLMPSYGSQTSKQDRWDMVNYMKSAQFGK